MRRESLAIAAPISRLPGYAHAALKDRKCEGVNGRCAWNTVSAYSILYIKKSIYRRENEKKNGPLG